MVLLICIALTIISLLYFIFSDMNWDFDIGTIFIGIFSIIGGFLLGIFIYFLISLSISGIYDKEYVEINKQELYALQDNNTISGQFYFLGGGHIDGSMSYCYLTKENNKMQMHVINVNNATIEEIDVEPKIVTFKSKYKNDFINNNFINFQPDKYEIYLPEGSIKYGYNINLN